MYLQEQAKHGDLVFVRRGSGLGYRSIVYKVTHAQHPADGTPMQANIVCPLPTTQSRFIHACRVLTCHAHNYLACLL